jgi:hypothetical protein
MDINVFLELVRKELLRGQTFSPCLVVESATKSYAFSLHEVPTLPHEAARYMYQLGYLFQSTEEGLRHISLIGVGDHAFVEEAGTPPARPLSEYPTEEVLFALSYSPQTRLFEARMDRLIRDEDGQVMAFCPSFHQRNLVAVPRDPNAMLVRAFHQGFIQATIKSN